MKLKTFAVNPFQMNSYLYFCDKTLEAVLIDPGYYTKYEQDDLLNYVNEEKLKIKHILLTHGHIDHVLGNAFASEVFGVDTFIHRDDLFLYENAKTQGNLYGLQFDALPLINNFLDESTEIRIGNNLLNIVHTPGHSPGGVCIVDHFERKVFCGDLIFQSSIGRTDLPGGNYDTLLGSIKEKLFTICSDEYDLYPGHMGKTTIGDEKRYNPFLQD